jgi:hypothetical protein
MRHEAEPLPLGVEDSFGDVFEYEPDQHDLRRIAVPKVIGVAGLVHRPERRRATRPGSKRHPAAGARTGPSFSDAKAASWKLLCLVLRLQGQPDVVNYSSHEIMQSGVTESVEQRPINCLAQRTKRWFVVGAQRQLSPGRSERLRF